MNKYERLAAVLNEAKAIMESEKISNFVLIDLDRPESIEVLLNGKQPDADTILTETKRGSICENGRTKQYVDRFGRVGGVKFTATAVA